MCKIWVIAAPNKHFLGVWYQKWMRNKLLLLHFFSTFLNPQRATLTYSGLIAVFRWWLAFPFRRIHQVSLHYSMQHFSHKNKVYFKTGWQNLAAFRREKNGNENFCQARIYNFCVKCVVFARNCKFAKLTQWNMQYIPCNSALLAQETLFLTQKGTFLPKDLQKVRKSRQILICDKIAYVRA